MGTCFSIKGGGAVGGYRHMLKAGADVDEAVLNAFQF